MSRIDMEICLTEVGRVLKYCSSEQERKDAEEVYRKIIKELSLENSKEKVLQESNGEAD